MKRFDFPVPFGWFDVGLADDLRPGEVRELEVFGEHLMLWRGEDGGYHLQENFCPHLGANIGADGRVVGNEVECPFHNWRFDGEGKLTAIPYAPDAQTTACLRNYPVREYYGVVLAWFHPAGAQPLYELPAIEELDSSDYRGPLDHPVHRIHAPLQELAENSVDGAHFVTIHKHPGAASFASVEFDGFSMTSRTIQEFPSSKGPVRGTLDSHAFGLGIGVIRYRTLIDITMLGTSLPVDEETSIQRFRVFYKNPDDDPKVDRIAKVFRDEVNRQVNEDIPIWNKKIFREKPVLTQGEAAITRFRTWVKQFYANAGQSAA